MEEITIKCLNYEQLKSNIIDGIDILKRIDIDFKVSFANYEIIIPKLKIKLIYITNEINRNSFVGRKNIINYNGGLIKEILKKKV